ncbi:nucleoplasmin-2 [Erinaceus europaeus]|uniref:Nucleoplasmin-2 n=1 Tax=Erinaceus europaeus TaxID=9365 RepID=A0A1S3A4F2_ERIEU|nr:nucleoplasmin-2 [Erinaceus europaeus]
MTTGRVLNCLLWSCELNQEKRSCTVRTQKEGRQDSKLVLSTICMGDKAKEELHLVEALPQSDQEDSKKARFVPIASLHPSVLPMVIMMEMELAPPVTFQLRVGSGPVFISGQESFDNSDLSWEEEAEEEDLDEEEEEEEEEDDDADISLEETPVKQSKRLAPSKQSSAAKKKKIEKEEEPVR